MILAVQWAKELELIDTQTKWYNERRERGHVLENSKAKHVWDFEYHLKKTTTYRRPDLTLEDKETNMIWLCNMACPQEVGIELTPKEAKRLLNSDQLTRKVVGTMQKMILMDSETLMRKILSGLIQLEID